MPTSVRGVPPGADPDVVSVMGAASHIASSCL
jgi:hypothetical protein